MDALLIYKDRRFIGKQILQQTEVILGRGGDIVLDSQTVSRRHAAVRRRGGRYYVLDLASANGTLVNGQPILTANEEVPIRSGDQLEVGEFVLRCIFAPSEERMAHELANAPEELDPKAAPAKTLPNLETMSETVRRQKAAAFSSEKVKPTGDLETLQLDPAQRDALRQQAAEARAAMAKAAPPTPAPAPVPGPALPLPPPVAPAAPPSAPAAPPSLAPSPPPPAGAAAPAPVAPPVPPESADLAPTLAGVQVVLAPPPPAAPAPATPPAPGPAPSPSPPAAAAPPAATPAPAKPADPEKEARIAAAKAKAAAAKAAKDAQAGSAAPAGAPAPASPATPPAASPEGARPAAEKPAAAKPPAAKEAPPAPPEGQKQLFKSGIEMLDTLTAIKRARCRLVVATEQLRTRVPLEKALTRVGRTPDNDVALGHPSVSSKHASIRFGAGGFEVVDHESTNFTFVNGFQVPPEKGQRLEPHTAVAFGAVSTLFLGDPVFFHGAQPPARAGPETIAEHLIEGGVLTKAQAKEVLREAREKDLELGEILVLRGFLTPERWAEVYRASEAFAGASGGAAGGGSRAGLVVGVVVALVAAAVAAAFGLGLVKIG